MRPALAVAALLAVLPAAAAGPAASTLDAWAGVWPVCVEPYPGFCVPLGTRHSWWFHACSDQVAVVEWVVVATFPRSAGSVVLNGSPGAPGSVGPCYGESGDDLFLVADCVAVQVTMSPEGEVPQHREAYDCFPYAP